jgi:hypothetical protein
MLSGGFNWIALGWIIDLILEWKPDLMKAITDDVSASLQPFPASHMLTCPHTISVCTVGLEGH